MLAAWIGLLPRAAPNRQFDRDLTANPLESGGGVYPQGRPRSLSAISVSQQSRRGAERPVRNKVEAHRLLCELAMKFELDEFGVSRTVLACAGMGATVGMLLAGTLLGVAPAITAAIIGALGAGILGHFVEPNESSE
jgi:hypothetical protein